MATKVGEQLRAARLGRKLSLRAVAQDLGISASLLSQVETGKTQPSVSTLYAIVNHLGLSIDELLGLTADRGATSYHAAPIHPDDGSPRVQRAADNPVIEMENGVRWERLAVGPSTNVDPLLVTYAPGAASSVEGKLMRHSGFEHAYVLEGEITLRIDFETFILRSGDSLQFESIRPHMYANLTDRTARGIWYVIGRRQQSDGLPSADTGRAPAPGLSSAVDVLWAMDQVRGGAQSMSR